MTTKPKEAKKVYEPTNWGLLTTACREAMKAAAIEPGRYGGRYVARKMDYGFRGGNYNVRTMFVILADDDPDVYRDDESLDILAQCMPTKVHAIGGARSYLQPDGSVVFGNH